MDGGDGDWDENMDSQEEEKDQFAGSQSMNSRNGPMDIKLTCSKHNHQDVQIGDVYSLEDKMTEQIEKVIEDLGVAEDLARALLMKNKWSADKAIQAILNDPDYIEKTFKFSMNDEEEECKSADKTCGVCFCEYGSDEWVEIDTCGHGLCMYCYTGYLESKLRDGKESIFTYCPDEKCNMLVPERIFKELLPANEYERYQKFYGESFVDMQDNIVWCPGADCPRYFKIKNPAAHL